MPPTDGQPWIAGVLDGEHVVVESRPTLKPSEITDAFCVVPT